jgi:hypothetical protein
MLYRQHYRAKQETSYITSKPVKVKFELRNSIKMYEDFD